METRIAKLEEFADDTKVRLTRIEAGLDQAVGDINQLRVDMHKGFADLTKWVVGTALGMGAAGIVVMTFVLNYAAPRPSAPTAAPASVVIYAQPNQSAAPVAAPPENIKPR